MAQWKSARLETEGPRVRASPASLLCVLEQEHNPSLVLVQPRKTRPFITERLLMGRKESNQTKKGGLSGRFIWFSVIPTTHYKQFLTTNQFQTLNLTEAR